MNVALEQLARIETRQYCSGILEKLLRLIDDVFVFTVEIGKATPYVQACLEENNEIHLELSNEGYAELALGESERQAIIDLGWEPPDEHFPNYFQVVRRDVMTDQEIVDLLVDSLDRVYHAFDGLGDIALEIRPGALAAQALPDDAEVISVRFPGETKWIRVSEMEGEF